MKSLWKWIAAILLLLFSFLGWWFWFEKGRRLNRNETPLSVGKDQSSKKEQKQSENLGGDVTTLDTSNWKTYRNKEYGFELQYPDDAFVEEGKPEKEYPWSRNKKGRLVRMLYVVSENIKFAVNIGVYENDPSFDPQFISKEVLFSGDRESYALLFSNNQQQIFFKEGDTYNSLPVDLQSIIYSKKNSYFLALNSVNYSGINSNQEILFVTISKSFRFL